MSAFSSPQCPSLFSFSTPFWAMRLSSSLRMGMGVSTFGSTSKNSALWVLTPLSMGAAILNWCCCRVNFCCMALVHSLFLENVMEMSVSHAENLPIGYIPAILVCFIDEDHLGKLCEHGLVKAHCLVTVVIFL